MKIALFITATGKYTEFLPKLIQSADQYFLPNQEVVYVICLDDIKTPLPHSDREIQYIEVTHEPFPHASINRSRHYSKYLSENNYMEKFTHCFAIDADAYFASEITNAICDHEIVCVAHGAYIGRNNEAPFENNPQSNCYVPPKRRWHYVAGGFYGGRAGLFKMMCQLMYLYVQNDIYKGIMPIWHDESAINKFFEVNHEMVYILPPTYHYCEFEPGKLNPYMQQLWEEKTDIMEDFCQTKPPFLPKIIFIDKNKNGKGQEYYRN